MAFKRSYRAIRKYGIRSSARYGYKRAGGARGIAGIGLPWIGGAALGYFAPRVSPFQDPAIMALAVLPIRLPYGIQNIAKGYALATIVKTMIGGVNNGTSNGGVVV